MESATPNYGSSAFAGVLPDSRDCSAITPYRKDHPTIYLLVEVTGPENTFVIGVKGRDAWALDTLLAAGKKGCTAIDDPAPRWAAYVFKLRGHGLDIETVEEEHGGAFAGRHARYVILSRCRVLRRVVSRRAQ